MKLLKILICFFKGHLIEGYLEELHVLAKGKCVRCGCQLMLNKVTGGCMLWRKCFDEDFERMKELRDL